LHTNPTEIARSIIPSIILHVTDVEGNLAHFISTINDSNVVRYDADTGLSFHNIKEATPYFIFGGDATDRGNSDLEFTKLLVEFKKRHPDQVFLLAGNRDINKNRLKIELDANHIRNRLLHCQVPRWLSHQPTLPLDYVKNDMKNQKYSGSELDFVTDVLSIEQCQLIYLKWMLEKTMGCPHSFRYRKEELEKTNAGKIVTDSMVLNSFINETAPDGITGQYLRLAQIAVIIPNTSVLAVHGGFQPDNIGKIPNTEKPLSDVKSWIKHYNSWYQEQIQKWLDDSPQDLTKPACTDLDESILPIPGKPKSIIIADMLSSDRQFMKIPEEVSQYLKKGDIKLVLTGHTPCGDHPVILRDEGLIFINGDTGYAAGKAQTVDDTRQGTMHNLEIIVKEDLINIKLTATLSSKTQVETQLCIKGNIIEGDPYIGTVTPQHELVQCRLAEGNYRLTSIEGYNVKYTELTSCELQERLASEQGISYHNNYR
jgi:hypothetical protein